MDYACGLHGFNLLLHSQLTTTTTIQLATSTSACLLARPLKHFNPLPPGGCFPPGCLACCRRVGLFVAALCVWVSPPSSSLLPFLPALLGLAWLSSPRLCLSPCLRCPSAAKAIASLWISLCRVGFPPPLHVACVILRRLLETLETFWRTRGPDVFVGYWSPSCLRSGFFTCTTQPASH